MKYGEIKNKVGAIEQGLISIKTIWCNIKPLRGKELLENKRVEGEQEYKITTWYREDITEEMCIKYKGKIFNINSIVDPNMAHEKIEMFCSEEKRK